MTGNGLLEDQELRGDVLGARCVSQGTGMRPYEKGNRGKDDDLASFGRFSTQLKGCDARTELLAYRSLKNGSGRKRGKWK